MKKIFLYVVMILMFCNVGFALEKTLFDILEFDEEWDTDGKIILDNKDYVIWTKKDNDTVDKTERKIISFIHSDKESKKKVHEFALMYYLSQGSIEYVSLGVSDNSASDNKKSSRLLIQKNLPKNVFDWFDERVSYYNNEDGLLYSKSRRRDDNRWMYGVGNESDEWIVFQSKKGKLLSNTGAKKKDREILYKKAIEFIKPAADLEKKIKKLEQLYLAKVTGDEQKYITKKKDEQKYITKKKIEEKSPETEKVTEVKESSNLVPASSGTGFFISKEGHVVTNNHVVNGCNTTNVNYKGKVVAAEILARDRINDLALLQVDIKPKGILNISDEDAKLLEEIYVAGYPFGKAISSSIKVTKGVVSSIVGLGDNYSNFQIDAALQPGNSGGPIINNKGDVVGVAVSKLDYVKVIEAFGAIPENTNFGIKASMIQVFTKSNDLQFPQIKSYTSRKTISSKQIGDKIKNATVYLGCWMTVAKIEEMESKKTFFPTTLKGFDFVCYNSCKERNDDSFCRKQCSLQ